MPEGLVDRLLLTPERIQGMAEGLQQLVALEDPIGEVTGMKKRRMDCSSDRNGYRLA